MKKEIIEGEKNMDLDNYGLEEIFLAAIRSELGSKIVYLKLAWRTEDNILEDRLVFLAREEDKHRRLLEDFYKDTLKRKYVMVPQASPVPLPEIDIDDEDLTEADILEAAMEAELAAHEFYKALAERAGRDILDARHIIKKYVEYFADMELNHYRILGMELERLTGRKF